MASNKRDPKRWFKNKPLTERDYHQEGFLLVRDVMSTTPLFIRPENTLEEAAQLMRDGNCGCLPVGGNDRLIGMVTDRDLVVRGIAEERAPEITQVGEIMTSGIKYCLEDEPLEEAARMMKEHKIRRLVVLNQDKRLTGILSVSDFATRAHEEGLTGITEAEICRHTTAESA